MIRDDIIKIRIDIVSEQQHALSLMLASDGAIVRQGNGNLPVEEAVFDGQIDSSVFNTLVERLDDSLFAYASVYDHPDKTGIPLIYSVAFLDNQGEESFFEFRFATQTADLGDLLPYFDDFISQAVHLTDSWYQQQLVKSQS